MTTIKSKWRFNKVGQGAFYTGRIGLPQGKHVNFVYDCGTKSKQDSILHEIERFHDQASFQNKGKLNLFVLSHLDNDHTSHINSLLNGVTECELAVLPYLSRLERLFLLFNEDEPDAEYTSFLLDPVIYLQRRKVKKIILIDGGGDDRIGIQQNRPELPRGDDPEGNLLNVGLYLIDETYYTAEQKEIKENTIASICKDRESIKVKHYWDFYFYNKKQDSQTIKEFKTFMESRYDFDLNYNNLTGEQLAKIFDDRSLKTLRDEFKKQFKDINSTGLVVLHGPINVNEVINKNKIKSWDFFYGKRSFKSWENSFYTLLNGDIYLDNIEYPDHIQNWLKDIQVFQVPHHGSDKNWDLKILEEVGNCDFVINFGWGNTHGHPGHQVLDDIKMQKGWRKKFNTQFKAVKYKIKAVY